MCRFDQDDAKQLVADFDQATCRRFAGTGVVAGTYRTKVRELLAAAEPVEASDQRTHRDRRDHADAGLLQQLFDDGIVSNIGLHFFGDACDFFVEVADRVEMIAQQKKNVLRRDVCLVEQPCCALDRPRRKRANDAMIPQQGTQSQFDLLALFDQSVPMPHEFAQIANGLRRESDAWNVACPCEVGEQFGVGPVGLVRRLLHACDVTGMGEFDAPVGNGDQLLGKVGDAGTGLDGGMNVAAERSNDTHDLAGVVTDGLVDENFTKLVHDANLNDVLMVVKTDKNW